MSRKLQWMSCASKEPFIQYSQEPKCPGNFGGCHVLKNNHLFNIHKSQNVQETSVDVLCFKRTIYSIFTRVKMSRTLQWMSCASKEPFIQYSQE